MNRSAAGIENFFRTRYGREAILLPSGRLAMFLAFREWFRPGDRLLISPVNDDVVFFTILAAGLVPVVAPLDPRTGNLDPDAVDADTWSRVQGVMTTNLYGIPDRMDRLTEIVRHRGLVLIEDACQAFDSRFDGRRIGTFSDVSVFSLSKHIPGAGGILSFSDAGKRTALTARAGDELRPPRRFRRRVRSIAAATGTLESLRKLKRNLVPQRMEREGHRIPYSPEEVRSTMTAGGGLDLFDRWVRVDLPDYRNALTEEQARETLDLLKDFENNRRCRLEGTRELLRLGFTPSHITLPEDSALFRVPLFVLDREAAIHRFAASGLRIGYIYDPPLDSYADASLAECLPAPEAARVWSGNVLPVDPLEAELFVELARKSPPLAGIVTRGDQRPASGRDGAGKSA